jgi:hypothetical protein
MDDEFFPADWADLDASRAAEDEAAVRRFVAGPARGLDVRTVRGFVAECRRAVGPEPVLEPAFDMVIDGVRHEWGVWFRPRPSHCSDRIDVGAAVEGRVGAEIALTTVDSFEAVGAIDVAAPPPLPSLSAMSTRPSTTAARSATPAQGRSDPGRDESARGDFSTSAALPAAGYLSSPR